MILVSWPERKGDSGSGWMLARMAANAVGAWPPLRKQRLGRWLSER
jgi:hypothetical protein